MNESLHGFIGVNVLASKRKKGMRVTYVDVASLRVYLIHVGRIKTSWLRTSYISATMYSYQMKSRSFISTVVIKLNELIIIKLLFYPNDSKAYETKLDLSHNQ